MPIKITLFCLLAMVAFLVPWWVMIVLVVASILSVNTFYTLVFIGFEMDIVYGAPPHFGFPFLFTALVLAIAIMSPRFKRRFLFIGNPW